MADLRTFSGSALLVKQYVEDKVTAGATSDSDYNNLYNDWLSNLATTGKVERFKAAGAGPAPRLDAEAPDFTLKDMAGNTISIVAQRPARDDQLLGHMVSSLPRRDPHHHEYV